MNASAPSFEMLPAVSASASGTDVLGVHDMGESFDLEAFLNEVYLVSSPSVSLAMLQVDTYPDVTDLGQDYTLAGSLMPQDTSYYNQDATIASYPATLDEANWAMPSFTMPYATMSPTFSPTSSSLYNALQEAPSTPPQPQPQSFISLVESVAAGLSLTSNNTVAPAQVHISPNEVALPLSPEFQYYSSPSPPSSPAASSSSASWAGDSDANSDTDSDYAPAPKRTRKSTKAKPPARFAPYAAPPSPASSSTSVDSTPVRRAAITYTTARTAQVAGPIPAPRTRGPRAWHCPHCAHVQRNHHLPDLRRHLATHYAASRSHVCRGVRAGAFAPDALPGALARFGGAVQEEDGELYVGGCFKAFSRRDALLRHLRNANLECCSEYTPRARRAPAKARK
ncbi:hypothetical protein PsYK624_091230 [Phanerochaete sordida]|uniref:Uncharacterized protein n=1 Tax=Phanerochaete sordida TaxID=48140 RepID=A0A9P3LFT4_9APHY|nr:hypothetical protein PsYK624_091230 [Phanerochaete sordida]